jgi:hypothetical protein
MAGVLFDDLVSILKNFADGSKKLEVKFWKTSAMQKGLKKSLFHKTVEQNQPSRTENAS